MPAHWWQCKYSHQKHSDISSLRPLFIPLCHLCSNVYLIDSERVGNAGRKSGQEVSQPRKPTAHSLFWVLSHNSKRISKSTEIQVLFVRKKKSFCWFFRKLGLSLRYYPHIYSWSSLRYNTCHCSCWQFALAFTPVGNHELDYIRSQIQRRSGVAVAVA